MKKLPDGAIEIFLSPGEFCFGDANMRLRTLLGSCVAITLWHPRLRIGGMCHYLLPSRPNRPVGALDGHYADEALELFMAEVRASGTRPNDYEVKLFGGGSMFDHAAHHQHHARLEPEALDVALRNVECGRELVQRYGLRKVAEHLGGSGHRNVIFDIWSGEVWVRHVARELS